MLMRSSLRRLSDSYLPLAAVFLSFSPVNGRAESATGPANEDALVRISIYELSGPMDQLKEMKLADIEKLQEQPTSRPRGRWNRPPRAADMPPLSLGQFSVAGMNGTVRVTLSARVPYAESPPAGSQPARSRGVRVSYGEVGFSAEGTARPDPNTPDGRVIDLKWKITPAYIGRKSETSQYQTAIHVAPDKPSLMLLDDGAVAMNEHGTGRLRYLKAQFVASRKRDASEKAPVNATLKDAIPGETHGQVDCFQLVAAGSKLSELDTTALTTDRPSPSELLKRLSAQGDALQTFTGTFAVSKDGKMQLLAGQRVPTVQDVVVSSRGQVTPSATYEEVGNIMKLDGLTWKDGIARGQLTFEASGIGSTSVEITAGIKLPSFTQWKLIQDQSFRNGVPEYFVMRGSPSPPKPEANTMLYVFRLVLTRGE